MNFTLKECHSLSQFAQKGIDIPLTCQPHHNVQLFHLDVRRVVVFAEKDAHFVGKDIWALLEKQIDVAQRNPLDFGRRRDKGDWASVITAM
jgi:hypothetical protein